MAASQSTLIRKLTLKKIDLQYMGQLAQIDIMKAKALMDMNIPHKEFQQEVYLKQIDGASNLNMNKFREDRKDDRTKIQAGQQS
jgi:hypothetical protein